MNVFFYRLWQCTWGILQTLLGLIVFLANVKNKHYVYHGSIVTEWANTSSVSLGLFVFVTAKPYFYQKLRDQYTQEELSSRLLVHEYGHTIQSLLLGPLYLIVIGIPSSLWGMLPTFARRRKQEQIAYCTFFTERWANALGEQVTGKESLGYLVID